MCVVIDTQDHQFGIVWIIYLMKVHLLNIAETKLIVDKDILGFPDYKEKLISARKRTGLMTSMITGNAKIKGKDIVFCGADFGFFGASFCMSNR